MGLVAGGMLTEWVSWRWVLFVNVPIGDRRPGARTRRAARDAAARRTVRPDRRAHLDPRDGLAGLWIRPRGSDGWGDELTLAAFAAGVSLLVTFVFTELHASSPITPLHLLTNRNRSSANITRALLVAGMFGMFFFLTQFLQDVLGYSPLQTGVAFLP